jgi:Ser/Thr protein kinase RdoA (MazF antagonist)
VTRPADLSGLLRAAVASGDWSDVRGRLADDAVLRTCNERGRTRVDGADAIAEHLGRPGPGDVLTWDAREWPTGVAITLEWDGGRTHDRRRWYARTDEEGRISQMWSSSARPTAGEVAGQARPPEELLRRIGATGVEPLAHGGNSGAALLRAVGAPLVLKRVTPGADWLGRVTADDGRTARLYEDGVFAAMPAVIRHGIVAVHRDAESAWVVMEDVGGLLIDGERRLSRDESRTVLGAAAALHSEFRGRAPEGAASLARRLGFATPAVAVAERDQPDLLPKQFEHAWEAFADVVDDDVAGRVLALVGDPARLAGALIAAHGGATLIHGDLRDDNLGFDGDRVVLIDWDMATAGTPTVDFAWYLAQDAWRIDATHDELEADHRAAHGGALATDEIELGILSGLVQYGWLIAHSARVHPDPAETAWGLEELAWWVPRARRALEHLGGGP